MSNFLRPYSAFVQKLHPLFPLSANVDILLFLMGLKSCVRTRLKSFQKTLNSLEEWCKQFEFYFDRSADGFIYIASNQERLRLVNSVDHSHNPHEQELGELLGYPACCCRKIAEVGEMQIDAFEDWLITQPFNGPFKLINPYAYRQGKAFISHVPCSTSCTHSLDLSKRVAHFLIPHQHESVLRPWMDELRQVHEELLVFGVRPRVFTY